MPSNRIIVCMNSESQVSRLTGVACAIARQSHAHLVGMNTTEPASEEFTGSMYMVPANASELEQEQIQMQDDRVEQAFMKVAADECPDCEWQEMNSSQCDGVEHLRDQTQSADLLILQQSDPLHESSSQMKIWHEILERSCCPVLVVPHYDQPVAISQATLALAVTGDASDETSLPDRIRTLGV